MVGFPFPSADGTLQYVKTPAAIWGAGAVISDEISRSCRPDIQNKLFPIIHERKVQGLPLVGLQYRWAAMNPPDRDEEDSGYLGSEPLDTALADRFPFVIDMPAWRIFTKEQQLAVIQSEDFPKGIKISSKWRNQCGKARASLPNREHWPPAKRVALQVG